MTGGTGDGGARSGDLTGTGSHVIMMSQPQAVTDVIRQAIDGVSH